MVVMIEWEDDKLLKLKGTSAWAHDFAYLSHYGEGTLSSSLLWHARFGHINYDSLRVLKKNRVSGLPTIPRNLKQNVRHVSLVNTTNNLFMIPL
jgi:hypothetical protein